jgi:hypothetical protein
MATVDSEYVGDVWPIAHPGEDPVLYGSVELTPTGAFEARSLQTFSLVYTVGRFGLDDTGSIKVVHRYPKWMRPAIQNCPSRRRQALFASLFMPGLP